MSSEQVAGILRQCSQKVTLVVARSVREPTSTDTTMQTSPPILSQQESITSESLNKTTNTNISLLAKTSSYSIGNDNEANTTNSQTRILLRTERLLENNHNFEKILENLREQVHFFCFLEFFLFPLFFLQFFFYFFLFIDIVKQEEKKRERLIILKKWE